MVIDIDLDFNTVSVTTGERDVVFLPLNWKMPMWEWEEATEEEKQAWQGFIDPLSAPESPVGTE